MKKWMLMGLVGLCGLSVWAEEIIVELIPSNGVLIATGMEPLTSCVLEWASRLQGGFTNDPAPFEGLIVDSNGLLRVEIPMFFRVKGILAGSSSPAPSGMVQIPGGTNNGSDPEYGSYALTVASFYMDVTEITKTQWDDVHSWAIDNGYDFDNLGSGKGTNHPVVEVNWYDCVKWCNARSEKEGTEPCYTINENTYKSGRNSPDCNFNTDGYRLPTDDEWQYAARGGLNSKRFPWGDTITHGQANYWSGSSYAYDISSTKGFHPDYDGGGELYTSPGGSFAPNGYGLYDMAGNVAEWCNNEKGPSMRSIKDGSWYDDAAEQHCLTYKSKDEGDEDYRVGFRAVRR